MKKCFYALAGLMTMLAVFITTANASENGGNAVNVVLIEDGEARTLITRAATVGELLGINAIELHELDRIVPGLDAEVVGAMQIEIARAFVVYLLLDGAEEPVAVYARPDSFLVSFVNDLEEQTGLDYVFDKDDWQRRLSPGDVVELTTIRRVVFEDFEDVAYETEYNEDDELLMGERRVYRAGVPGLRQISTLAVHVGGEPYSRTILSDEIVRWPVNEIAYRGTYLPPYHALSACGEVFSYSRSFIAEATAYTLDFASTGRHPGDPLFGITASGMQAQVGVVAVDTNVIPFHTRLYIEGYGFAVAGDRGGAIRGEKVDLFFDTREETLQFGRQHIWVWILDED